MAFPGLALGVSSETGVEKKKRKEEAIQGSTGFIMEKHQETLF